MPVAAATAASNAVVNCSKLPNAEVISLSSGPVSVVPSEPFGAIDSQNRLWFACPPPLLRTTFATSAGTAERFATICSTDCDSSAVPATAPLSLST